MNIRSILFVTIILISIVACKKSDNKPVIEPEKKPDPVVNSAVDVYVGGTFNNKAAYWKNEALNKVQNDSRNSIGYAITVKASDVYLAGITINPGNVSIPTYWKNGLPTYLSTETGAANGIAIYENDVYVVGYTVLLKGTTWASYATLWKNGTASYFDSAPYSSANAIFVSSNGDVYVAGNNDSRACYWKNGTIVYVGAVGQSSSAYSIAVSGSDVYTSGYFYENPVSAPNQKPVYWKNNLKKLLPIAGGVSASIAPSIAVSGTDVHVVGYGIFPGVPVSSTKGLYWKNDTAIQIDITGDPEGLYAPSAIAVDGTDLYTTISMSNTACLMKNFVRVTLNTTGASSFDYKAIYLALK